MAKVKLLDRPQDFEKLGVNPNTIEVWEDRRRNLDTSANNWEWWYFDAILDDGSTVVAQFFTKSGLNIKRKGDFPAWKLKITAPDGKSYETRRDYKAKEASFGDEQCDVRFGQSCFKGDLKNYSIRCEETDSMSADITLESLSSPYRPGTAYFNFDDESEFYTWLCVVPKGKVTGTLTYAGKTVNITGFGYHDHQWGSVNFLQKWNHWVWARQSFEDYSMLVFDMVATEKNDYTRFPIVFIQDKNGNIVFENTENVTCDILGEYKDDVASGKIYPNAVKYVFENDDKRVDYTLSVKKTIEANGAKNLPAAFKLLAKAMGMGNPSYSRYLADGSLKLTDGDTAIERSGELIYEFMFPGESFKGHM